MYLRQSPVQLRVQPLNIHLLSHCRQDQKLVPGRNLQGAISLSKNTITKGKLKTYQSLRDKLHLPFNLIEETERKGSIVLKSNFLRDKAFHHGGKLLKSQDASQRGKT